MKIPKYIEKEVLKSYKNSSSTRWPDFYRTTDKLSNWLTEKLGLTTCNNETVIDYFIVRFDWHCERWVIK